jgi:hypothetical protein
MTNTRITDPEILERRYPVVLRQFRLRPGACVRVVVVVSICREKRGRGVQEGDPGRSSFAA